MQRLNRRILRPTMVQNAAKIRNRLKEKIQKPWASLGT